MRITCPACGYCRETPGSIVPANAALATCPKCRHKFSFREELPPDGKEFFLEQGRGQESISHREADGAPGQEGHGGVAPDRAPDSPPGEGQHDIWNAPGAEEFSAGNAESRGSSQEESPGEEGQAREEAFASGAQHTEWDAPWERLDRHGFFQGFWLTTKGAMLAAPTFFKGLRVGGGLARPLVFYLLIMEVEAICQYLWHTMGIGFMTGLEGVPESGISLTTGVGMGALLLLTPLLAALGIYIASAFLHLVLMIVRAESRGFEGTFRAVTYGSAPMVLSIFPVVGMLVGSLWSMVTTVIALKHIHNTTYIQIVIAILLQIALIVLLVLAVAMPGLWEGA